MRFMKKNYKILVVVLLMAAASCSFTTKTFDDPNKDKLLIDLITHVLEQGHYDAKIIDDDFSRAVYSDYLTSLDTPKRFLYAKDIEEFNQYEDKIDDHIKNKDISFFDLTHSRIEQRMEEARGIYEEILARPFDFNEEEEFDTDYENVDYVNSKEELKERWRKQLKFSTLTTYHDKLEEERQKKENDEDYTLKSNDELEVEAREITANSLNEYFEYTEDLERKDYFSVYINAIVDKFDPHTFYFAPQDKDRFDIAMSGKLEGIGARLQKKNDDVVIMEVISGGPAWRSDELSEGDVILKVKQEDEEVPVNIAGMRLDDAVNLIKGPKDSKVTLVVRKKVTGIIEDITLIRDVVEIEETYAKTSLVKKNGKNFGVINLPKFYFNMEDYEERNAASDVKQEIIRLKEQDMHGLVLDLRNNGGGSLKTVVDIAGLFIEEGPIVQVKSKEEGKEILKDRDSDILWDGPLVILVNELSASASEILAAAMQDYKRAIIIGSKQTYGKGTVQNVIDLNRWMRNNDFGDMGALKLTTQKFYRVNGGSTQLEGVKSDVVVPNRYSFVDIGEKDQKNPLPWDKIEPADYEIWEGYDGFDEALKSSKERMSENAQLKLIEENAQWVKNQSEETKYSLNIEEYSRDIEENKEQVQRFEAIKDYTTNLTYLSLPYEEELFENDTILEEKRVRWHENLKKDVYIEEAIHLLEDMKLRNNKSKFANINKD